MSKVLDVLAYIVILVAILIGVLMVVVPVAHLIIEFPKMSLGAASVISFSLALNWACGRLGPEEFRN